MYIVESTISLFQDKKYRTRERVTDRDEKDYELSDREAIKDKETNCGRWNLGEDVILYSCCESCKSKNQKKRRITRKFHTLSQRQKRARISKRVKGIEGSAEALAILQRLNRNFPDSQIGTVSNLSLLVAIRTLRLSYNSVSINFNYL